MRGLIRRADRFLMSDRAAFVVLLATAALVVLALLR